jgi:hypothetical protein
MRDTTFNNVCVVLGIAGTSYIGTENNCNADRCLSGIDENTRAALAHLDSSVNSLVPEHYKPLIHTTGVQTQRDAMPGDTDIANKNGTAGLHVGQYIAQLYGGAGSLLELDGIGHKATLIAFGYGAHTPLTQDLTTEAIRVRNTAANISEAFGHVGGGGYDSDGKRKHSLALPYYRSTEIEGEAVDGIEQSILEPLAEEPHTLASMPLVLSRVRRSYSGELSQASAFGFSSIKTLGIEALLQYRYGKEKDGTEGIKDLTRNDIDILERYIGTEEPHIPQEQTEDAILDEALTKLENKVLSRDYIDALVNRMQERGLVIAKPELPEGIEDVAQPHGPATDTQYTTPEPVEIGGKKYYNLSSFITQEPNGDILLCDGYGSEIRLSHGNIIISPALDLKLRPGRDMHALVPGYMGLESGKTTTLEVNSGDLLMHAPGHLKLSGATGEKSADGGYPVVSIESGAGGSEKGKAIVIRASGDLSVTGANDVVFGRAAMNGSSIANLDTPKNRGALILHAGSNGDILENASTKTLNTGRLAVVQGNGNNAMVMQGQSVSLHTRALMVHGKLQTSRLAVPAILKVFSNGETQEIRACHSSEAGMYVDGHTKINGSLNVAGGARFNGRIAAKGVTSTSKDNVKGKNKGNSPSTPWYVEKDDPVDNSKNPVVDSYGASVASNAASGIFQSSALNKASFSWPSYNDLDRRVWRGTVWQKRNVDNDAKYLRYKVNYIKNTDGVATAPYPGARNIDAAVLSLGKAKPGVQGGYVTNIPQQENK